MRKRKNFVNIYVDPSKNGGITTFTVWLNDNTADLLAHTAQRTGVKDNQILKQIVYPLLEGKPDDIKCGVWLKATSAEVGKNTTNVIYERLVEWDGVLKA